MKQALRTLPNTSPLQLSPEKDTQRAPRLKGDTSQSLAAEMQEKAKYGMAPVRCVFIHPRCLYCEKVGLFFFLSAGPLLDCAISKLDPLRDSLE